MSPLVVVLALTDLPSWALYAGLVALGIGLLGVLTMAIPKPREMTAEEETASGPEMDLRRLSAINRANFDPALLAPYIGQWIAWSPDSSHMVAHAEDIKLLEAQVVQAGEDPSRCPIEYLDGE